MNAPLDQRGSTGEGLEGTRRPRVLFFPLLRRIGWFFIGSYLKLFHRLTVVGAENLPAEPPFILVANHSSPLDFLVLSSPFSSRLRDRIHPIAPANLLFEEAPAAIATTEAPGDLPVGREPCHPKNPAELRKRLTDEPCAFVLFPEGPRTRTGQIGPFKRGMGSLVASTLVPVVPCYLEGAFAAFPPRNRLPRPKKVTLLIGSPLRFPATSNDQEGWMHVAGKLEAAVRALAAASASSDSPAQAP